MKKTIAQLIIIAVTAYTGLYAQTDCAELNGYVNSKNTNGTGYYTLNTGLEEKAAQTYHYSGPGKVTSVRIYGNYPSLIYGGVPLRAGIYNVDATGRPTSLIKSTNITWWWFNNADGYLDVYFSSGGAAVNNNFAVVVELLSLYPWGNSFQVGYTGNGEGRGEDLATLAGTSTGGNWTSALTDFSRDGDFYLIPNVTNFITSNFTVNTQCITTGGTVNFTNTTQISKDSMFNTLVKSDYMGTENLYTWDFGDGTPVSHAVNPSHTFASAGSYEVSLTSTFAGWTNTCSDTKTMKVSVGLSVSATSIVNANCNGADNGSILALGNGGDTSYAYSLGGTLYTSNPSFTGLSAGTYQLYIRDNLNCTVNTSVTITEPTAIQFSSTASTNASCGNSDGAILVIATGGTGPLQYKLNTGAYKANGSFTNLAAGSYTITVKDANTCTVSTLVTVNDAGGPSLSLVSMTNVSCNNGSDGSIVLNATGGSGTLQYSINGGTSFQTGGSFLNIPAGDYPTMVKDAAGCAKLLLVQITQPSALTVTASSTDAVCYNGNNGKIIVTSAIGGTGSFSYSINGINYKSGTIFTSLHANTYTVYVKDAAGCIGTTSVTVGEPSALTATITATPVTCNMGYNGSISVSASGGTPQYLYTVSTTYQGSSFFGRLPADTYVVRVKDANNCVYSKSVIVTQPPAVTAALNTTNSTCGNSNGGILITASGGNGAPFQYSINDTAFNTNGSFTGLLSGNYFVIVKDNASCRSLFQAGIIDADGPTITSSTHTNISCKNGDDGTITVNTVTGGTGLLQYSLNGTIWQTSTLFMGLEAGNYTLTVKDANGCTGAESITLTQPNGFTINTALENINCYGDSTGSITIFAAGGAGVFAYRIGIDTTYQASNIFDNLSAGAQIITVRDAAGCSASKIVTLTQSPKLNSSADVLTISCNGSNDGAISISASGGIGSYTYSIDGDTYQTSTQFDNLSGGTYTTYVEDSLGCIASKEVSVYEPSELSVTSLTNNVSCSGGNNANIDLHIMGGTLPYTYSWSTGAKTEDLFNLTAGSYTVKVTDNNGCTDTSAYNITEPQNPLVVNGVVVNATTAQSNDGSIDITITGGVAPYSYSWSNEATSPDISDVTAGTYTVYITDKNQCITSGIFTIGYTTGISDLNGVAQLNLYPNPSNDYAILEIQDGLISTVKIFNIQGMLVSETEPKQAKTIISTADLSSGVYFIQAFVNGTSITKRWIINK